LFLKEVWDMSGGRFFPRRLSFPKICNVLVAYLNAGAERNYVGLSEVTDKTEVTLHNISRNNNFFKSWGFVEESEKEPGKYRLTPEAAEFASAYRIDPNGDHTRQLLRRILEKEEIIRKLVERIKREGMDRRALMVELPGILGDLRADKVGLNAFLDMLAYAFNLETVTVKPRPPPPVRRAKPSKRAQRKAVAKMVERPAAGLSLSINLAISPETSPEKLKEYIKAVLKAYDEYSEEKGD